MILVPKCAGPSVSRKWNVYWPLELEEAVTQSMWKVATPGALVLARIAELTGIYDVMLIEEEFEDLDLAVEYDIVAVYTITPNVKRAYELAGHYKSKGAHIVLGGVHVSVCHAEACEHADTLIIGEAESVWNDFLLDFNMNMARDVYIQPVGVFDINRSPIPAFHLLPQKASNIIPVQTARGCPHGCKFCNLRSIYGSSYRAKSSLNIENEVKAAKETCQNAVIYFTDDNLFCNPAHAETVMRIAGKYGMGWYANTDISFGHDREYIKKARECGCRQVLIGLESINPNNLTGIDENDFKSRNFNKYKKYIENIQFHGIGVIGSFILGLDEDDICIFDRTAEFIMDTKLYGANITVNTPYPGTESFEQLRLENRILTYDWNQYTIFNPVILPKKMTVDELNEGYVRVLKKVHSSENILGRINYFKDKIKDRNKTYVK